MIPLEDLKQAIRSVPIICVDVLLENDDGEYLLGFRNNEPLKDEWYVFGGRLLKGETAIQAAERKVKQEVGCKISDLRLVGFYEDFFDKNSLGVDTLYHTVSIVYHAKIESMSDVQLDSQHKKWKFSRELPERFVVKKFSTEIGG